MYVYMSHELCDINFGSVISSKKKKSMSGCTCSFFKILFIYLGHWIHALCFKSELSRSFFFELFSIEVLNSLTLLINWAVKVNFFRDRIAFLNGKESHYSDSAFLIKHCFIFKISIFHGFLKQFRVEVLSQNVCVKTIQEVTQQKCLLKMIPIAFRYQVFPP